MEVIWWKNMLLWFPQAIQRHASMGWLTLKKVDYKKYIDAMGFLRDSYCAFYRNKIESREHLYFECSFTKRIWKHIMGLCLVTDVPII